MMRVQDVGPLGEPAQMCRRTVFHRRHVEVHDRQPVGVFPKPGKDFRARLISAFDAWLEVPPESLEIITKVVGMLHTASLLVDDVEDSSLLRRGGSWTV